MKTTGIWTTLTLGAVAWGAGSFPARAALSVADADLALADIVLQNGLVNKMDATVGNGGDAVVCRDAGGAITTVELLDFYEARVARGQKLNLGDSTLPLADKVDLALDRMLRFSAYRTQMFKTWAGSFESERILLPNVKLVDIPDSAHIVVPNGCEIEQIAIQRDPQFEGDKRYTISKDLWDRLDTDNQAGLILHEIVYRDLKITQRNSISTRYWTSALASASVPAPSTPREMYQVNRHVGFTEFFEWGQYMISMSEPRFHETTDQMRSAHLYGVDGRELQFGGIKLRNHTGLVTFYEDGKPENLYGNSDRIDAVQLGPIAFKAGDVTQLFIKLAKDGKLIGFGCEYADTGYPLFKTAQWGGLAFERAVLTDSGQVELMFPREFELAVKQASNPAGGVLFVASGSYGLFDPKGNALRVGRFEADFHSKEAYLSGWLPSVSSEYLRMDDLLFERTSEARLSSFILRRAARIFLGGKTVSVPAHSRIHLDSTGAVTEIESPR